jgi:hypothetical protein
VAHPTGIVTPAQLGSESNAARVAASFSDLVMTKLRGFSCIILRQFQFQKLNNPNSGTRQAMLLLALRQ